MFDLKGYLRKNTSVKLKQDNEWVIPCVCDQVRGSEKAHLWINLTKQAGFCFRCQARYSLVEIVRHVEGCDIYDAFAIVRENENGSSRLQTVLSQMDPDMDVADEATKPRLPVVLPPEYEPITKKVPRYLRARGVSLSLCRIHEIGVCRYGYYRNRIIVPVYDLVGKLALFVARWDTTFPKPATAKKILYPKGSRTSRVLFNHKRASAFKTVVVTEGVFDAMRAGSRAVAVFGKHVARPNLVNLMALGQSRKLVIMLDPDAVDDAEALAEELIEICPRVYLASLPSGRKDPGEATPAEIREAVSGARRVGGPGARLAAALRL